MQAIVRDSLLELNVGQVCRVNTHVNEIAAASVDFAALCATAYGRDCKVELASVREILTCKWELLDESIEWRSASRLVSFGKVRPLLFHRTEFDKHYVVVIFRGTRVTSLADWYANLRWITRHIPFIDDKYRLVRHNFPDLIKSLQQRFSDQPLTVITAGHSLGGGLAQQAAYASGGVASVYAFNPTFVTGWYETLTEPQRRKNAHNLRVFRIYQHLELLSFFWWFVERFYPLARAAHPQVSRIRVHVVQRTSPLHRHGIATLAHAFFRFSQTSREKRSGDLASIIDTALNAHVASTVQLKK